MENTMTMYNGKVYGVEVSGYGVSNGYLDYRALSRIIGHVILNNNVRTIKELGEWELVSGEDSYGINSDGEECESYSDDCYDTVYYDVYQDYIISYEGYQFLSRYTDEIVYYNDELDMYIWGITHFGTSWDYVLTNVKLANGDV